MYKVDDFVNSELNRQKIPGIAAGIFKNGKPLHLKGYGLSNIEHNVPVLTNTVFQTASIGKMFTAMAVMILVEDKKLILDESIKNYLPNAPADWQPITLRHLLTHTAGLGATDIDVKQEYSDEEYLEQHYSTPIDFPAGTRWSYSNTGYSILGFIVNNVANLKYWQILEERIFKPASMHTARILSDTDIVMNRSAGYESIDGELKNQQWTSASANTLAEGSLYMSLEDYLKWNAIISTRGILSQQSWDQILTPVQLNNGQSYPYGFGWDIQSINNQLVIGHEGSWQGFRTAFLRYEKDNIAFTVLANSSNANVGEILNGIAERYDSNFKRNNDCLIYDEFPLLTLELVTEIEKIADHGVSDKVETNIDGISLVKAAILLKKQGILNQLKLIQNQPNGNHFDRVYKANCVNNVMTIYASFDKDLMQVHSIFIYTEERQI
ncbi:serine hydrolase domain-containing protein [Acinetobacter chinensis]|nr:serine hydrolase domain-containing protein [Acinetobacter chinensis]